MRRAAVWFPLIIAVEKQALRAGNSLQLAAALTRYGGRPAKRVLFCGRLPYQVYGLELGVVAVDSLV